MSTASLETSSSSSFSSLSEREAPSLYHFSSSAESLKPSLLLCMLLGAFLYFALLRRWALLDPFDSFLNFAEGGGVFLLIFSMISLFTVMQRSRNSSEKPSNYSSGDADVLIFSFTCGPRR